jgi:hypothetical protein
MRQRNEMQRACLRPIEVGARRGLEEGELDQGRRWGWRRPGGGGEDDRDAGRTGGG